MCPDENPDNWGSILQMNSQLQHAQLELLSAHCATHQLRLHYSADDLARFGRRDLLRKSAEAASALSEFYATIEKRIRHSESGAVPSSTPSPEQISEAVGWLSTFLSSAQERYAAFTKPLPGPHRTAMQPYFSSSLLDRVRVHELHGERIPVPDFFATARALGFDPPEISHMDSLTFVDVIVFNEEITERVLFHGLVHAVQIQALGLERYAELWVRSFVKTRAHYTVPTEVHAFSLASRFARSSAPAFSVEEQVQRWIDEDRY